MLYIVLRIKIHLTVTYTIQYVICRSRKNALHDYMATFLIATTLLSLINFKTKPFESEDHSHCIHFLFIS